MSAPFPRSYLIDFDLGLLKGVPHHMVDQPHHDELLGVLVGKAPEDYDAVIKVEYISLVLPGSLHHEMTSGDAHVHTAGSTATARADAEGGATEVLGTDASSRPSE